MVRSNIETLIETIKFCHKNNIEESLLKDLAIMLRGEIIRVEQIVRQRKITKLSLEIGRARDLLRSLKI